MVNKRGQIGVGEIMVWAVVLVVIGLATWFLIKADVPGYARLIPSFGGEDKLDDKDGQVSGDEEIEVDLTIDICPPGWKVIGVITGDDPSKPAVAPYRFWLGDDTNSKQTKTNIMWDSGKNFYLERMNVPLGFFVPKIIPSGKEKISVQAISLYPDIFDSSYQTNGQKDNLFELILEARCDGDHPNLYKNLLLFRDSIRRDKGFVCQKEEIINNIDKKLEEVYWQGNASSIVRFDRAETRDILTSEGQVIRREKYIKIGTGLGIIPLSYGKYRIDGLYFRKRQDKVIELIVGVFGSRNQVLYIGSSFGVLDSSGKLYLYCDEEGKLLKRSSDVYLFVEKNGLPEKKFEDKYACSSPAILDMIVVEEMFNDF